MEDQKLLEELTVPSQHLFYTFSMIQGLFNQDRAKISVSYQVTSFGRLFKILRLHPDADMLKFTQT